jgi:hypothetical protein
MREPEIDTLNGSLSAYWLFEATIYLSHLVGPIYRRGFRIELAKVFG